MAKSYATYLFYSVVTIMLMQSIFDFLGEYVKEDGGKKNKVGFVSLQERIKKELMSIDVHPNVAKRIVQQIEINMVENAAKMEGSVEDKMLRHLQWLLTKVMRGAKTEEIIKGEGLKIIKIYGAYGAGKTTCVGKMVHHLRSLFPKAKFAVTSLDNKRKAGQQQLSAIAGKSKALFIPQEQLGMANILGAIRSAARLASERKIDFLIIDTPAIDVSSEDDISLSQLIANNYPAKLNLWVADGLAGKSGYKSVRRASEVLPIDAVLITKMTKDGDIGSAINARIGSKKQILCISSSERLDDIKPFNFLEHSSSLMARIKGIANRMGGTGRAAGRFSNFHDLRRYLAESKSPSNIAALVASEQDKNEARDKAIALEMFLDAQIAIIDSMTLEERSNPSLISLSRMARIAKGCGSTEEQVEALCGQVYRSASAQAA